MNAIPPVSKAGPGVAWRSNFLAFALLPWLAFFHTGRSCGPPDSHGGRSADRFRILRTHPVECGPADIAVSVQRRDTGTPLPDADIELQFIPRQVRNPGRWTSSADRRNNSLLPSGAGVPAADSVRAVSTGPEAGSSREFGSGFLRRALDPEPSGPGRIRSFGDQRRPAGSRDGRSIEGGVASLALPPITILLYALNRRLRHSPSPEFILDRVPFRASEVRLAPSGCCTNRLDHPFPYPEGDAAPRASLAR